MSLLRLLATGKSLVGMRDGNSPYRMCTQNLVPNFGVTRNPFRPETKTEAPAEPLPAKPVEPENLSLFDAQLKPMAPAPAKAERPCAIALEESFDRMKAPVAPCLSPTEGERVARSRVSCNHGLVKPGDIEVPAVPVSVKTAAPTVEISQPGHPAPVIVEPRPILKLESSGNPFAASPAPAVEKSSPVQKYPVRRPLPRRPIKASGFTRWLAKMNPVAQMAAWGKMGAGRPARPKAPEQAELLLAQVKPLRNELNESDLRVVTPTVNDGGTKTEDQAPRSMMAGVTGPWNRLTKIFGTDHVQAR